MRKSLALVLLALGFIAVWWRDEPPSDIAPPLVQLTAHRGSVGQEHHALSVKGLWRLESGQKGFGAFSALAFRDRETLWLFGDTGSVLELPIPEGGDHRAMLPLGRIGRVTARKSGRDIEAATAFGSSIWLALEHSNAILRLDRDLRIERRIAPQVIADWPPNGGPEAMARLDDGRFLVLREGRIVLGETDPVEGVLFAGDPTEDARFGKVAISGADGYHPVDAAVAPDGRVLVLLRRLGFGWPFEFRSRLAMLDPADLDDGRARLIPIPGLPELLPSDNYEGMAVRADGDRWEIWLVSDDNESHFQSTWLAQLSLDPTALAR